MSRAHEKNLRLALSVLERASYAGYDPYDGLGSPWVAILPGAKARLIFTHLVRKSPVNPRPLLGIPRTLNPKTLALCLSVYSGIGEADRARQVIGLLEKTWPWGYPFPWQSRAFFVPRGTPTAVNTALVLHALADVRDALGLDTAGLAEQGAHNILRVLRRNRDGFFSYTPLDDYRIHNANLLLASALARVGFADDALRAARSSLGFQRPDGSFLYGQDHTMLSYIDNFHTGFVLLALSSLGRTLGQEFVSPARNLLAYYRKNLFLPDGTPLFRLGRPLPHDVHVYAVAAGTFAEMGDTEMAGRLISAMERLFLRKQGRFGYQRGRFIYHRQNYARWGQAWACWAYAAAIAGRGIGPG